MRRQRGFWAKRHQTQSIQIDRDTTVFPTGVEFETSIIGRGPSDHGISRIYIGTYLSPYHFTHASPVTADIDTCTYLQQPYSQTPTQTWRGIFNHDDQHHPALYDP